MTPPAEWGIPVIDPTEGGAGFTVDGSAGGSVPCRGFEPSKILLSSEGEETMDLRSRINSSFT